MTHQGNIHLLSLLVSVQFLEIVHASILVNQLFVAVFAANSHVNEGEDEETKIEGHDEPEANPPNIEV